MAIRVLLVDDHALFRRGLASLLAEDPEFVIVGEAADGIEAVEQALALRPDVILMDIYMPRRDGIAATRLIRGQLPHTHVIVLTVSDTDRNLFEALKAGALGYLPKTIDPADLYDMVRRVARGEALLSPQFASRVVSEFGRLARAGPGAEELTPREREVLGLVAKGATNKEIAASFSISENTVRNHLRNILEKLHLENRTQLAAYALREGLVGHNS